MALTSEQIDRIRARTPGWDQADLQQLMAELLEAMEAASCSGRLRWPCDDDRQDFVAQMLADALRRAREGTLLAAYDPTMGDVAEYLTGYGFRKRAIGYLIELAKRLEVLSLGEDGDPLPLEGRAFVESSGAQSGDLSAALTNLRLSMSGTSGVTKVLEQAGLQLFLRLDWAQPGMYRLRSHLQSLRPGGRVTTDLTWLEQNHRRLAKAFRQEIDNLEDQRYNFGRGVNSRRAAVLGARLERVFFESVFLPLAAPVIMDILAVTRNTADQIRRRYRQSLPALLPDLKAAFAAQEELEVDTPVRPEDMQ